ncbi:hypothetical protein CR513_43139, partial [Mucuna pruriens]
MTKSSFYPLYDLDPKIQITLCWLRKDRNIVVSNSNSSNFVSSFDNSSLVTNASDYVEYNSTKNFLEPAQTYELKFGLIHLLHKFHGLAREDPHKYLKEFHVVCSTMRLQGISEDYIKMKVFLFSLDAVAKDWLYLQPVLFNTWGDMKRMFLEKFLPTSRIAIIRKEICGIRQYSGKTLHEY